MTRAVKAGNVVIGGGAPISIQSMTNTPTSDATATLNQIRALEAAGCDIVRLAVGSAEEVQAARSIIGKTKVALVADIQFDYRIAVACADMGFDKIRFNPGNIGGDREIAEVVAALKANKIPVRVGVNGGSLGDAKGETEAEKLVDSALKSVSILEKHGFYDTVISVKSSSVPTMVEAYSLLSSRTDYPLHLGVTESGAARRGLVKSAVGIGSLLLGGIGDTIRVSLTGDPVEEVEAAILILSAAGKYAGDAVEIISCPTCSRCRYDLAGLVSRLEKRFSGVHKKLTIAVMGCVVNGPGEAGHADIAVCGGGNGKLVVFEGGKKLKVIAEADAEREIAALADRFGEN